jgi:hypothetical protein
MRRVFADLSQACAVADLFLQSLGAPLETTIKAEDVAKLPDSETGCGDAGKRLVAKLREMLPKIDAMTEDEWGNWIDALPEDEFLEFVRMDADEMRAAFLEGGRA